MQQNTVEISKGLRFIFAGLCLNILTVLPVPLLSAEEAVLAVSVLAFGLTVSGLIFAGRGDKKYYVPLVLLAVNTLGVEMLQRSLTGMVVFWLAIVRLALSTVTLSLICAITLPWVAQRRGKPSRMGRAAWVGCVVSGVLVLAFNLLAMVPGREMLAAILSVVGMAALVVTAVLYMVFVWQAGTWLK